MAVAPSRTTAVPRPTAARPALRTMARTATRSGLSFQPARSIWVASRRLADPIRSDRHGGLMVPGTSPPRKTARTATPISAPGTSAAITKGGSNIGQPHPLQAVEPQQPAHPQVARAHDREHQDEKYLSGKVVIRVEVWRAQRGQDQEEGDWERDDDRRRRTGLHLKCLRLALDLLSAGDGGLQLGEQRRELATARSLDEDRGCEHVEKRLGDAITGGPPGLAPPE